MLNLKQGVSTIIAIAIVIAFALVVFGEAWYHKYTQLKEAERIAEQQLPLVKTPQTTATSATSTPAIDTSGWQTYRNENYEFEFRYPKEWVISTRAWEKVIPNVLFEVSLDTKNPFSAYPPYPKITIYSQSLEEVKDVARGKEMLISENEILVSNIKSKQQIKNIPEGNYYLVFIPSEENLTFEVIFNEDIKTTMNQMLSTFKFLD